VNPNKLCGPNGIRPRLLKTVADKTTSALTWFFRNSYALVSCHSTGNWPRSACFQETRMVQGRTRPTSLSS